MPLRSVVTSAPECTTSGHRYVDVYMASTYLALNDVELNLFSTDYRNQTQVQQPLEAQLLAYPNRVIQQVWEDCSELATPQ